MSMSDPIADLLTRIRNALKAKHDSVKVPSSKMKIRIVDILKNEGYIADYHVTDDKKQGTIEISLKYIKQGESVISGLKRHSTPGQRVYCGIDKLPKVRNGLGIAILSTPKGVVTDEEARRQHVGGEWICSVW